MAGFRSLGDEEEVEFECKVSDKGLEATMVSGVEGSECKGSNRRPMSKKKFKKIRCYNCGEFANHIASKCNMGPQPKRCHHCKDSEHLIADCPKLEEKRLIKKTNGKSSSASSGNSTNGKQSNGQTSGEHSEEESILNAAETASSSSEKHLSDSGIGTRSSGKTPTTDDTKSESPVSDGSRGRDV
ncbi:protein lin-28 homolog isoform X2 [Oppia nitens]|nr:protein lin-28 homolog isoform X2 [Oppia nitens]